MYFQDKLNFDFQSIIELNEKTSKYTEKAIIMSK